MKILILVLSFSLIPFHSYTQQKNIPELEAYFSALIVEDIDSSLMWYTKMLGFKITDKRELPEIGLKQSNLEHGNAQIELIELNSALKPKEVIPDHNSKTRLIGLFKIGFLVSEFDKLIDHLKENNVKFHGTVVINEATGKRMVIIKDPDENRIQIFEN